MDNRELFQKLDWLLERERSADVRRLVAPELAKTPDDPELHLYLARAAYIDDDYAAAAEHVTRVLSQHPLHHAARVLFFHVLAQQKDYVEAEQVVTSLIRENPGDAELLANYAHLMLLTLHLDKAEKLAGEALRREPGHEGASLVRVLIATSHGKHREANEALEPLVRANPEAYRIGVTLYYALIRQKRLREAERVGRQLLRARPGDGELVESLIALRLHTHWASWPAYPAVRYGWAGVAAIWFLGVIGARVAARFNPAAGTAITVLYLFICIYSWVYPPLLKRWLMARGL